MEKIEQYVKDYRHRIYLMLGMQNFFGVVVSGNHLPGFNMASSWHFLNVICLLYCLKKYISPQCFTITMLNNNDNIVVSVCSSFN